MAVKEKLVIIEIERSEDEDTWQVKRCGPVGIVVSRGHHTRQDAQEAGTAYLIGCGGGLVREPVEDPHEPTAGVH